MGLIQKLNQLLSRRHKLLLLGILLLSILFATIETAGISLLMVFIALATNPSTVSSDPKYSWMYRLIEPSSPENFVMWVGAVLIAFYIARAIYSIGYAYILNRFTWNRYHDIAQRLFRNYLSLTYREFTDKNSSQLEKTILTEASYLSQLVIAAMRFVSEAAVAVLLYAFLLYSNAKMTLIITLILGVKVALLMWPIKKVIGHQGELRESYHARLYSTINDAFGNFKLIKLLSNKDAIVAGFSKWCEGYSKANIVNMTVNQLPASVLEAVGLVMLTGIVMFVLATSANGSQVVSVVSLFALAMYRMVPAVNRMLFYLGNVQYYRRSLDIVHQDTVHPVLDEGEAELAFQSSVELKDVVFSYPGRGEVLKGIDLTIHKNEKVAIVGPSGCGKSTLIDVIIGIHHPDRGALLVDGTPVSNRNVKSLRRKVGYIPQHIYLFDGTVAQNIAFGQDYDEKKIERALRQARIYDFLMRHEGFDTHVGEGGIKLSGGQRQRIGIARALYTDPEILVLDEATSALDQKTEEEIMDEIYEVSTNRTLLVVSHRLSLTERCDKIYAIENGYLASVRTGQARMLGKNDRRQNLT